MTTATSCSTGTAGEPDRFGGRSRTLAELGELVISEMSADARLEHRADRPVFQGGDRHAAAPHYLLAMPLTGRVVVEQHGRLARLDPYDLTVYDPARPYSVLFEEPCRMLTLTFPQPALHLPEERVAELTATRIAGARGVPALLCSMLNGLPAAIADASATQAIRLADNLLGLVTTTLAEHLGTSPADPAAVAGQRSLLLRMQAFAEDHLADADLSPTDIAAAVHVSIGYLHKVFRAEGTTASRWIRSRRLEHCRRELTEPALAGQPVSEVAARWGFVDAAHFSKLFKNAYGLPPREYRVMCESERKKASKGLKGSAETARPVAE